MNLANSKLFSELKEKYGLIIEGIPSYQVGIRK